MEEHKPTIKTKNELPKKEVWSTNVICPISKQRMLQPSSHQLLQLPQLCTPRYAPLDSHLRMRITGCWPQRAEIHIREMTSVSPDSCILPHIESTRLLNLRYLLFLVIFQVLTCLIFVEETHIAWFPSHLPPWSHPSELCEMLHPRFTSSVIHQIKHNPRH